MADGLPFPAQAPNTPGFPSNPEPILFDTFSTLNTKPTRNAIEDQELFWCDGFMPIGKNNARVIPDVGTSIYTATVGKTIISFYFANLATAPVAVVLLSDGSLVQVNTATSAVTSIAGAGTITIPSKGIGVTQASGNQFIIIVAPQTNGYWLWNGTSLATAGTLALQVTVTNGGSGYTSQPTITASGGSGSGATFSATLTNGIITAIKVTNPGSGWKVGETVTLAFSGGGGSAAAATIVIMPFGVSGTTIEIFNNQAWVANGATVYFTAPSSVVDFSASNGGGLFTSQDSFLRVSYNALRQSNGFLYLLGDSSANTVSGVQTAGTPPVTTFSNQNVDPQIGTPWKDSVQVFSRNIVFANSFGIHISYGGAMSKISPPLDGIYATVPVSSFGSFSPSSAVASIFGIQCYALLYPVIDQITNTQVNKLLMWDGGRWFTSQQSVSLTYIASQEINSILTAWGTDGTKIYPLFNAPSTNFTKTFRSKLWDRPGYFYTKTSTRLFALVYFTNADGTTSVSIDNENTSDSTTVPLTASYISWVNNLSQNIQFQNNSGQNIYFVPSGFGIFRAAVGQNGQLIGMTITSTCSDLTLSSFTLFNQVFSTNL